MAEYITTLFNGTEHSLRLLEVWGVWLSSIGTLAAVITALWLGLRSERIKIDASVQVMRLIPSNPPQHHLVVRIVNTGVRPVTLGSLGWTAGYRWGPYKQRTFWQRVDHKPENSPLPVELRDGAEAIYYLDMAVFNQLREQLERPEYRQSLKLEIFTSQGKRFRIKPNKSVFEELNQDVIV